MAKKKGIGISSIVALAQVVLGIVAFCILFAKAIKWELNSGISFVDNLVNKNVTVEYTGFEAFLGKEDGFNATFGGIMVVILLAAVVVLALLKIFLPKLSKLFNFIIVAASIVTAIFLFCGTTGLMISIDDVKTSDLNLSLLAGAIVPAIIAIVNAAASLVDVLVLDK